MKHMQSNRITSLKNGKGMFLFCMCFFSIMLFFSCTSIPGEREMEQKNLASEYYDIALKYMELKQYDKALACFQKAREKTDDLTKIDYQIARTYAFQNNWKDASVLFEELLSSDPGNSNLKENLAYTLYKSGQKEKALQLYAELCESLPSDERIQKNYEALTQDAIGSD